MLKEFKDFAMRGNVVDMAVGIIIGAAFGKIVSSLVSDVIMPPIGMVMGGVSFSDLSLALGSGEGAATLNYGMFIDTVISFLIIALAVFMLIKGDQFDEEEGRREACRAAETVCRRNAADGNSRPARKELIAPPKGRSFFRWKITTSSQAHSSIVTANVARTPIGWPKHSRAMRRASCQSGGIAAWLVATRRGCLAHPRTGGRFRHRRKPHISRVVPQSAGIRCTDSART